MGSFFPWAQGSWLQHTGRAQGPWGGVRGDGESLGPSRSTTCLREGSLPGSPETSYSRTKDLVLFAILSFQTCPSFSIHPSIDPPMYPGNTSLGCISFEHHASTHIATSYPCSAVTHGHTRPPPYLPPVPPRHLSVHSFFMCAPFLSFLPIRL